jgi:hypothetical protein
VPYRKVPHKSVCLQFQNTDLITDKPCECILYQCGQPSNTCLSMHDKYETS